MPRVRPYESQVGPTGEIPVSGAPLEGGPGRGAQELGQSLVQGGYTGAHAYQIIRANQDAAAVADAHLKLAQIASSETQRFADFTNKADPADPNVWETFRRGGAAPDDEVARVDSLQYKLDWAKNEIQNPVAQRVFDQKAAQLSQHFLDKSVQLQGHLAGVYAKQQATTFVNDQQTRVQTDPSEFKYAINDLHAYVAGIPRIDAGAKAQLTRMGTEQIGKSMVQGMLTNPENGKLVLDRLDRGDFDSILTGEDKAAMRSHAQTSITAMEVEARRVEADRQRQQKAKYDATDQKLGEQFGLSVANPGVPQFKPVTALQVAKLLQNDEIDGPTGRVWLNMIDEHARRGPIKRPNNDTVERNLSKRIYLPDGDPKKIIDTGPIYHEYWNTKQIDEAAMGRLRDELVKSRSPEGSVFGKEKAAFLKGMEPLITKPGPFGIYQDPTTPEKFANFQRELDATIAQYHKDGKDPRTLFDPDSKDYFGKIAKSNKYQSTEFGSVTAPAAPPAAGSPPRKPLEEIFLRPLLEKLKP